MTTINNDNKSSVMIISQRCPGIAREANSPNGKSQVTKYPKDQKTMAKLKECAKDVLPLKHLDDKSLEVMA